MMPVQKLLVLVLLIGLSFGHYVSIPAKSPIELEEFLTGAFVVKRWNGSWISDTSFIFRDSDTLDIMKYDMTTKISELFLPARFLESYPGATVTVSNDEGYVLIRYNVSTVFRHSTTAQYTIYDINSRTDSGYVYPLSYVPGKQANYYDVANSTPVQLSTFAPVGHGLIYVLDNNIYYLEDFSVDVQNPVAITEEGTLGTVYCGIPDWVYEEEVLGSGSAVWFSPSASRLAYAVFHDENVRNFSYYIYGEPGNPENLYPTQAMIRYPKVGTPNPVVTIHVYDISEGKSTEFQLPDGINKNEANDYVLYDLTWVNDEEVSMISTNRVQNESQIVRCQTDGSCSIEVSYKEENGWLEPKIPIYKDDGKKRLEIIPEILNDLKYDALVLTDVSTGEKSVLVLEPQMVLSIYGWDYDNDMVYYLTTINDHPENQHVYSVNTRSLEKICLSCGASNTNEGCPYASASFSTSSSWFALTCTDGQPPFIQIYNTRNSSDVTLWEDNGDLKQRLSQKLAPKVKDIKVEFENSTIRARLLLPPDLDETLPIKYPAIVNVYGGPNSNQISGGFSVGFAEYIVTNRNYIYIYIDGRGSGRENWNRMFEIYRRFGTVEIEDQIIMTKYLQENLPYIDAERTGIWGWSYGGFASAWALVKDNEHVFNFALSVAPVTNFIYYDTIYTERYMGLPTPEDNLSGYNDTDLTRHVEAFRNRNYFIIHGNADDNVHYQNAMLLVKALEHADVDFRQQSYPDENHGLGRVYPHLYHSIDNYWVKCFTLEEQVAVLSWF